MRIHSRARTNAFQRRRLAEKVGTREWTIRGAARRLGASPQTIRKWLGRPQGRACGGPFIPSSDVTVADFGRLKALILSMRRYRMTAQTLGRIDGVGHRITEIAPVAHETSGGSTPSLP
jgi:transposase-like protein